MERYNDALRRLEALRTRVRPRYWFDLDALTPQLLPYLLRRPRTLAYLRSLLTPAAELYALVLDFTLYARRELSYNGQTLMMEKALNDRFDPQLRRIRILNSDQAAEPFYLNFGREEQPAKYLYNSEEGQPPRYLFRTVELYNQTGFTVRIPGALRAQEVAINTRIKQLKIALVKYRLIYFY